MSQLEIDRYIAEQRKCAEYRGPDMAGAWHGLCDWLMEEVLIRLEMDMAQSQRKLTIDDLKARCPLVEIAADFEEIKGLRGGAVVLRVKEAWVTSGTMRKFQAAYGKAVNAGLIKGAA